MKLGDIYSKNSEHFEIIGITAPIGNKNLDSVRFKNVFTKVTHDVFIDTLAFKKYTFVK